MSQGLYSVDIYTTCSRYVCWLARTNEDFPLNTEVIALKLKRFTVLLVSDKNHDVNTHGTPRACVFERNDNANLLKEGTLRYAQVYV